MQIWSGYPRGCGSKQCRYCVCESPCSESPSCRMLVWKIRRVFRNLMRQWARIRPLRTQSFEHADFRVGPSEKTGTQPTNVQSGKRFTGCTSLTEQRIILNDGRTLGFAEYGDPNGEPVLEFHGIPGSRLEAWSYDDAGKKVGARVIGVDRPGFGLSAYRQGYRIVHWPTDVLEFANALGLKSLCRRGHLVGLPLRARLREVHTGAA